MQRRDVCDVTRKSDWLLCILQLRRVLYIHFLTTGYSGKLNVDWLSDGDVTYSCNVSNHNKIVKYLAVHQAYVKCRNVKKMGP